MHLARCASSFLVHLIYQLLLSDCRQLRLSKKFFYRLKYMYVFLLNVNRYLEHFPRSRIFFSFKTQHSDSPIFKPLEIDYFTANTLNPAILSIFHNVVDSDD